MTSTDGVTKTSRTLVAREGVAKPGDYVSIVIFGRVQVNVSTKGGTVQAGQRLTFDSANRARTLRTTKVNDLTVAENAPTIGIALESTAKDGKIWVLVNPK